MQEAWSSHETWVYECLRCFTTWEEEVDIRHCADGHGGDAVVYERDGQRCTTPWVDRACPSCASQYIKAAQAPLGRIRQVPPARAADDLEMVFRLRRLHAY